MSLLLLMSLNVLIFCLLFLLQQEKPYVCGMCGDTFVTSESLKQHSLIHSNIIVGTHRSFDESTLYSYQQGTRIGSPLPKAYDRGVHIATSQLCSQDHFSTSFPPPPMISTPVQVSALNIQQKQPQYRRPSSQAQQYMEISPYNTGDTRPVMVASTLAALALDSAVSKPWNFVNRHFCLLVLQIFGSLLLTMLFCNGHWC